MKKSDKFETLKKASAENGLCRMYFSYDPAYFYYLPIAFNDNFFYGTKEEDFITDGFAIRKISDLKKVEIKDDKCIEFLRFEKTFENLNPPPVKLDNWKSIFESLKESEKHIIIRKEGLNEKNGKFFLGRILKVNSSSLDFHHVDADGIWYKIRIRFSGITTVKFRSRYVKIWEKYL